MDESAQTHSEMPPEKTGTTRAERLPKLHKLLALQDSLENDVLSDKTEPKDKASCARAWKELELLRRIMLGKPVTVEPAKLKMPKARKVGIIAPMPEPQQETGS